MKQGGTKMHAAHKPAELARAVAIIAGIAVAFIVVLHTITGML
jgi:hypothetical protein